MFKKPKDEVRAIVHGAISNSIRNHMPYQLSQSMYAADSTLSALVESIAAGVSAGIVEAMNQVYTHEEFEEDLGLKDKP